MNVFYVGLQCPVRMASGLKCMARRRVSMVYGPFVASRLVIPDGYPVVTRRIRKVS